MEDKQNPSPDWLLNPPTPPGFEKEPEKGHGRTKRLPLTLIAAVCTLILGLGIWIGAGVGRSEPTEPPETTTPPETTAPLETTAPEETTTPPEPEWKENILRDDPFSSTSLSSYLWDHDAKECPVFGSGYQRQQIASVTFLDTLTDAPESAWDVSEAGDGRVMAWVTPANDLYDLYIAAEGGVNAGTDCSDLFAGYTNVQQISFGDAFHTIEATDMNCMFLGCKTLTNLDLSSFDTSNVQTMAYMFQDCDSLTELSLSSFNTTSVIDMRHMFYCCSSLTDLNLTSFDTSNVWGFDNMFYYCNDLTELDLSSFDTSSATNMRCMFLDCTALKSLTLSEKFRINANTRTQDIFTNCPAGTNYLHLLN